MDTKRILIIDDETAFARLVKFGLESTQRYVVKHEGKSQHALSTARVFQPELILLDLLMPGWDGCDLEQAFRADAQLREVPIVLLTDGTDYKSPRRGLHLSNGKLCLSKPVSLAVLVETIEQTLLKAASPLRPSLLDGADVALEDAAKD